ncbi:MAG: PadR family transcriptional regulator [Crenarchaeota archaeon]|nr:PadR family transcriptional regulator [Thermoproteota archaeon]MCR8453683.1 PadR family transcriptional regulator [Thermoproteota archaeon]MCR8455383.1 PadR family transcriptional regulator [Thermoproteota archaeon]MCR8463068.1 PadR family transcriptional regulator [Thermoproteota archaeon]MCR8471252.1 PadR family transcriptional regulator [Thermoproteota archaeon]
MKILSKEPLHGYALTDALKKILDQDISRALVYVVLRRLEKKGLVKSKLEISNRGPARRVYFLTDEGKLTLQRKLEESAKIVELVERIRSY